MNRRVIIFIVCFMLAAHPYELTLFGQEETKLGVRCSHPDNAKLGQQNKQTKKTATVKDLNDLIQTLRANGASVERNDEITQPFFSVKGKTITVNGEKVQVFEYANGKAAEKDARRVDRTGSSTGNSMVSWVGPPHFFKRGKLIVLYVGEKADILQALESALGSQFAGK